MALLSDIFIFLVRAAYEQWQVSYASKLTSYAVFWVRHAHSKTKRLTRTFYLSNDCSTIGHIYSLGWSCMWDPISELRIQTRKAISFPYDILFILALVTRKVHPDCIWTFYMSRECSTIVHVYFFVRAGHGIWMETYVSKAHCRLSYEYI